MKLPHDVFGQPTMSSVTLQPTMNDANRWIAPERERLRQRYLNAFMYLTQRLHQQGDYASAVTYAQELLMHDPGYEPTHQSLMRVRGSERCLIYAIMAHP